MSSYPVADEPLNQRLTPAVTWLIALSVATWFLQVASPVGPADMQRLLGFSADDVPRRWWTAVTYLFVHGSVWHLAFGMYALFLFGPRVEREWSTGELVRFYVVCGMGGLLAHLVFFRDAPLVGASAAVYGVMLAYARRWPDDQVYLFAVFPIRVRWLVALLVVMSLVGGVGAGDGVGLAHFAHLGGFAAAWVYLRLQEGAWGRGFRPQVASMPDIPDETPRAVPRGRGSRERAEDTDEIVAKSKAAMANQAASPAPRQVMNARPATDLDAVLDKISRQGLQSLTPDERRLLDEASRRLRDN